MSKQLYHYLYSIFPQEHQWKVSLLAQWKNLIGTLKDKVILEKITDDSLVLTVVHSTWAQELYMLSPMLLKKVNGVLGHDRIKHIKFKVGQEGFAKREGNFQKKNQESLESSTEESGSSGTPHVLLNKKEKKMLEKIDSQDLAHELILFYERCKRVTVRKKL